MSAGGIPEANLAYLTTIVNIAERIRSPQPSAAVVYHDLRERLRVGAGDHNSLEEPVRWAEWRPFVGVGVALWGSPRGDLDGGCVMFGGFVGKAAGLVASGLVGAAAYDGVKSGARKIVRSGVMHGAAVTVTSWGLRGVRAAETGAERARLATADVVSEARERIGEQTPAPGAAAVSEHEH